MIRKTISGHYDTVFSTKHNNREFVPSNVDESRFQWNYYCVAAGQLAPLDLENPKNLAEFWAEYRELSQTYWEERTTTRKQAYEAYQKHMEAMRKYRYACRLLTDDGITAIVTLLLLPLLLPCQIYMDRQLEEAKDEYEKMKEEQWLRDMEFNATKLSFRETIAAQDQVAGTQYLQLMDSAVREMARQANDHLAFATYVQVNEPESVRFATLEEIYDKLYEPSFREYQNKQRPCRRYPGTYLESIREGRSQESRKRQQSKNAKIRKTAEAIEIVFGIGDMDNTGYAKALSDARKSEMLLKDFADHLTMDPHLCFVTTKELEDPNWVPPFYNGLIILNLTVHCDEATPGVHLTCIPYSRGCKRGPSVQAALGRAMTGMGYPSIWTDALDANGHKIQKKNRKGELVYNEDGSARYRQKPEKQGIIDWIDAQKLWIQKEMSRRYGWEREYKGFHPRGNLSTPDYQVARAKERKESLEKAAREELDEYITRVHDCSSTLKSNVNQMVRNSTELEKVLHYLQYCPDEDYTRIMNVVNDFWCRFAVREETRALENLLTRVKAAEKQAGISRKKETPKGKDL